MTSKNSWGEMGVYQIIDGKGRKDPHRTSTPTHCTTTYIQLVTSSFNLRGNTGYNFSVTSSEQWHEGDIQVTTAAADTPVTFHTCRKHEPKQLTKIVDDTSVIFHRGSEHGSRNESQQQGPKNTSYNRAWHIPKDERAKQFYRRKNWRRVLDGKGISANIGRQPNSI
jgi:hypothetical protein